MKRTTTSQRARARVKPRPALLQNWRLDVKSILVPLDFSPASLEALDSALPLLKTFKADCHLVHVIPPDYPLSSTATLPIIVSETEIARRMRGLLNQVAAKTAVPLEHQSIHVRRGRPFEEICQLARELKVDLIVTSTHGHTGLKHIALGSTAERIVQHADCPVLILRRPKEKKPGRNGGTPGKRSSFHTILVPIDFSSCSLRGLDYAKFLAKKFGAKLVLINVVHLIYYVSDSEYTRYDLPQLTQVADRAARANIAKLLQRLTREGFNVETRVTIGHPGDQICGALREFGADLLVSSTHGTTGLSHILLGSTAEYIVRHAECPVLVVPTRVASSRLGNPKDRISN